MIYRTLIKAYGYRPCDATATTHYLSLLCGVAALLMSMYINGQISWVCFGSVSIIQSNLLKMQRTIFYYEGRSIDKFFHIFGRQ